MLSAPKPDQINALLHHFNLTRDLKSIKHFHARLLRTHWLFQFPINHANLIFSYSIISPQKPPFQSLLSNLINSTNPNDPSAFNLLLSEFCRNGCSGLGVKTLSFMHWNGFVLDSYPICSGLSAGSVIGAVGFGVQVHGYVVKSGWGCSVFVGSAVLGLYGRSGFVGDAEKMFDEMPARNSVCVNMLMVGFCEGKLWGKGIELVSRMPVLGLECDRFTLTAALSCCAGLAAVDMGRQVHGHLVRRTVNVGSNVFMVSALIEMYGKCGLLGKARDVFRLRGLNVGGDFDRDVVLWTSMLGAYGRNGNYLDVIKLYKEMLAAGIRPDRVVFVKVISACTLSGQAGLGVECFESMTRDFGLEPGYEHCSCIVDLLCRAGELEKAWDLVNKIPHGAEVHASLWGALLQACLDHGNINLGRLVARKVLELDLESTGIYALVLSLYAKFGMQDEIDQVTELMNNRGVKKDLGCSWIEVRN
ncbi:hypothetical protein Droror1_Dr00007476 [Drosera rotundifolia]